MSNHRPPGPAPSPLRDRVFRYLFASQLAALLGSGLTSVGLALLAYQIAGSQAAAVLGTGLAIRMIAKLPVAPFAGVLAARLPRRSLLIGLDILRAGLVFCYPFVTEVWQIYLLIFVFSACEALFNPVYQAALPDVLPQEERYTRALALSRIAVELETMAAPALASLLLLAFSFDLLFAVAAIALLVSASLILLSALANRSSVSGGSKKAFTWDETLRGLKDYWARPSMQRIFWLYFAIAGASSMILVNSVILVREVLDLPEVFIPLLLTASGIGSILGSALMPRAVEKWGDLPVITVSALALIPLLLVGSALGSYPAFAILWFCLGFAMGLAATPVGRVIARESTSEERTGLFAAQYALSHACWLVTYPLAGWTVTLWGLPTGFICLAAIAAIGGLVASRKFRST